MCKKYIFSLIFISFFLSCKKENRTTIKGHLINNTKQNKVVLKKIIILNDEEKRIPIDSVTSNKEGDFTFISLKLDSGIYELAINKEEWTHSFVIEDYSRNLGIKIKTGNDITLPNQLELKGSKAFDNLNTYYLLLHDFTMQTVNLITNHALEKKIKNQKLDSVKNTCHEKIKKLIIKVKSQPITSFYLSNILFSEPTNFPFLDSLSITFNQSPYQSEYIKGYVRYVNKLRPISIGGQINEITLRNPTNQEIKLSSLLGKYVLIDFWAAWCPDCRKENPELVKIYQKYKNKNFEIFGISLDKEKDKWIEAIKKDQLTWQHGSELRGWESSIAKEYHITSIPSNLLINPEGKIIAKNIDLNLLDKKLEDVLK